MPSTPLAFIGGGNIARSLIGGLIARGAAADSIVASEPNADLRAALARDFGIAVHAENVAAVAEADVWLLAVKPQVLKSVCMALAASAQAQRPLVISIAAGIPTAQIARWLGHGVSVVRCMPNTPALLGVGATGLFANAHTSTAQKHQAQRVLDAVGISVWIDDESQMDAVTATSGAGPAYVFLLAEAMQSAAQAQGLPSETARALVTQTVLGAARMLSESGESSLALRERVASPGGSTEVALKILEAGGLRAMIADAIAAARQRGAEIAAANEAE